MEKYAEIIKAMAECAGPDCGVTCPYKDKSAGGKSCRALLLEDAIAAIQNEEAGSETLQELLQNAETERDKALEECKALHADVDDLEAVANTLRGERDNLRLALGRLNEEKINLLNERDCLRGKLAAQCQAKTDRPSVGFDGSLAYWCGRADALAEVVSQFATGEASGNV